MAKSDSGCLKPKINSITSSPWGFVQTQHDIAPGLVMVTTPSHGGFMVGPEIELSEAARKRGLPFGEMTCYEEDIAWAIPTWELPQFWPQIFDGEMKTDKWADPKAALFADLSRWFPEYLIERGETPDPKVYRVWQVEQEEMKLWQAKDADFVMGGTLVRKSKTPTTEHWWPLDACINVAGIWMVTLESEWRFAVDMATPFAGEVVKTGTAAGSEHFVTEASYMAAPRPRRLSAMTEVRLVVPQEVQLEKA